MVRIVLDATGGDNSPHAQVAGAVHALERMDDISIVLCGPQEDLEAALVGVDYDEDRLTILDCPQTITNHDHPATAIRRKKDSAIVKGMGMIKAGEAQAFVSNGSTGGVLSGALLIARRMKGISRPALAPLLPTMEKPVLMLDIGANVDCKPTHLQQFAMMGSVYMEAMYERNNPRVALLNIGVEEEKGNELTKTTFPLIEKMPLHFIGNIEAREILSGDADVVVTDAFAGNVALKAIEGTAGMLLKVMKNEIMSKSSYKFGAAMLKPVFKNLKRKMDYEQYGGAPLLGVNGCVIKGHGSSTASAVTLAVKQARDFVLSGVNAKMQDALASAGAVWQRGEDA